MALISALRRYSLSLVDGFFGGGEKNFAENIFMILCLKGVEVGKVIDLYFLSLSLKNGIKNHKLFEVASGDTNPIFSPTRGSFSLRS
jgi:hypothetical protein